EDYFLYFIIFIYLPVFVVMPVMLFQLIMAIIAGVRAYNGQSYRYPFNLRLLK
ncbi:orotate phosphoribosyltransferase, partial [Fischerella thermalis CCMEE 5201]